MTSWQVVTVDARGQETVVALPPADTIGLPHHVLPGLVDAAPAEQHEAIWVYLEAAGVDANVVGARVYRVVYRVATEPDVPHVEVERDLAFAVDRS